ncbi:tyrosine-type recombinase/integrase [Rhizobium leguminosarum]|jgi:integrase|uniref:tyrosine-type recombinase/integrase n=1 Tax=Rhizobium TaxID=379 RepID=UPI001C93D05E|nr:site-specific integrase [Rhizobium leguminosarum]MBY5388947.1 tyrosine-type recombinase/integrase [Rhizobium leguminosarum]
MKINKKTVDALPAPSKDSFHWDEDLTGFGVKVTPAGRKVFVLQTRLNGRPRRYTIGTYGIPWSPDTARAEAKRLLGLVSTGVDPKQVVDLSKSEKNVQQLAELYWKAMEGHKKPVTIANERGLEERHIRPLLGSKKLSELHRHDVQKFLNDIAAGKTATDIRTRPRGRVRVKGGKASANRTHGLLSSMLSFAVEEKLIAENPALGVKQFKLKKHDRFLSASETESLGKALSTVAREGASPYAIAAIKFLALSGCRKSEALTLQWSWIDFKHRFAKLPDSKTGQKILFLGIHAVEFLQQLPRVGGSDLVFPSAAGGLVPISIQKIWQRVRAAAGLNGLRIHDLRHNFASSGVASGQSLYIVGKLLGHSQPLTTQRYAHLASDPVRAAADHISAEIGERLLK